MENSLPEPVLIHKQVVIANVKTMSDSSIRLTVDLLGGNADDFKNAFLLKSLDATMILGQTDIMENAIEETQEDLS